MSAIAELRAFNRFYTARIGLLDEHLTDSLYSLPQARVLYELAHLPGRGTAADLGRRLRMDKGQLSRILRGLVRGGLVVEETDPAHARRKLIVLTKEGRAVFEDLDRRASSHVAALIAPLDAAERDMLVSATRRIGDILGAQKHAPPDFVLRAPGPGDLGWIIHRQAVLYTSEYGWDGRFEGLIAGIVGAFVSGFDPAREEVWIAERRGRILGSVFLARESDEVGRMRLLYVEADARGLGVGTALVEACLSRARDIGYGKVRLWTVDALTAARHIYKKQGFRLVSSESQEMFGKTLESEIWEIGLAAD